MWDDISELNEGLTKPNFFVVGAPKCGTTAMCHYLSQHPDVFFSPQKELHYFGSDLPGWPWFKRAFDSQRDYLDHFDNGGARRIVGEGSVFYLCSSGAAREIHEFNPDARVLIMLRKPAEMLRSLHNQYLFVGTWEKTKKFSEAILHDGQREKEFVSSTGREGQTYLGYWNVASYADQVERYIDVFGRERVLVLLYDDFKADVEAAYIQVLRFLGLDTKFRPEFLVINQSKRSKSKILQWVVSRPLGTREFVNKIIPRAVVTRATTMLIKWNTENAEREGLDPETHKYIVARTEADVNRLGDIIQRDLSLWLGK